MRPLSIRQESVVYAGADALIRSACSAHAREVELVLFWEAAAISLRVRHDGYRICSMRARACKASGTRQVAGEPHRLPSEHAP